MTPRPRFIAASASPSARATGIPWGTHNHIIQLPGAFIELLTLAEPDKLGAGRIFKIVRRLHTRDFLTRGEGLSLLVLESRDARADEADFRAARIADSDCMRFEREAKRPDGTAVKVAFSLAFARDPLAPDIRLRHLPASLSGELLESGVSETCQRRRRLSPASSPLPSNRRVI